MDNRSRISRDRHRAAISRARLRDRSVGECGGHLMREQRKDVRRIKFEGPSCVVHLGADPD